MGVTMKKIAEIAGVSRATVDRVLNNRPNVKPEVRKRIMEIADMLGYEPNLAGKALVRQNKPYNIGVILPIVENDRFYERIHEGMKAAQKEFRDMGISVIYEYSHEYSVEDQLESIGKLVEQDISALALVPINDDRIKDKLNSLNDSIVTVSYVSDIESIDKLCFVGINAEKSGRMSGDLLSKVLGKDSNIIIITTSHGVLAQKLRIKGAIDAIMESHMNQKVIGIYENYDRDDVTYECLKKALEEHEQIDGIYSATGLGSAGLGKALAEIDPDNNIKVVASDLTPKTMELIQKRVVDFTITQHPSDIGYKTIRTIARYLLMGKQISQPNKMMEIHTEIRTIENCMD